VLRPSTSVRARVYHLIEPNGHKRNEIAARQLSIQRGYQRPHEKRLTPSEVKEMFERMRGHLWE
jgi:hypothetical protein